MDRDMIDISGFESLALNKRSAEAVVFCFNIGIYFGRFYLPK